MGLVQSSRCLFLPCSFINPKKIIQKFVKKCKKRKVGKSSKKSLQRSSTFDSKLALLISSMDSSSKNDTTYEEWKKVLEQSDEEAPGLKLHCQPKKRFSAKLPSCIYEPSNENNTPESRRGKDYSSEVVIIRGRVSLCVPKATLGKRYEKKNCPNYLATLEPEIRPIFCPRSLKKGKRACMRI